MVGTGCASPAADCAIEAFESTGRAQMFAIPGRELLFDMIVADRRPEVPAQRRYSFGLGITVGTNDPQVATQDRVIAGACQIAWKSWNMDRPIDLNPLRLAVGQFIVKYWPENGLP